MYFGKLLRSTCVYVSLQIRRLPSYMGGLRPFNHARPCFLCVSVNKIGKLNQFDSSPPTTTIHVTAEPLPTDRPISRHSMPQPSTSGVELSQAIEMTNRTVSTKD